MTLIIAGFGVELTPRLPTNVTQLEDGTLLFGRTIAEAQRDSRAPAVLVKPGISPDGPLEKRVDPFVTYACGTPGATQIALGHGVEAYTEFFDVRLVPGRSARWTILTNHELHWPPHFLLFSDGTVRRRSSYQLEFVGANHTNGQLLFVYGPFADAELPPPPALVGPGMTMVGDGDIPDSNVLWFELWYEHDNAPWKQLVYYVPCGPGRTFLIRAQSPTALADAMFAASDVIAQTLRGS